MKKLAFLFALVFTFYSQDISSIGDKDKNEINSGLGLAWIDGEPFYSFSISPDLSFGNFGVGVNIELFFNKDGDLRTDMYDSGASWLRIIRYIRYGYKGDTFYSRFGSIDNGMLGNGFLMFHYNNASNYENRKMGIVFDIDFENYGFESIYSNFGRPEILGLRGYYRPLAEQEIPVVNTLEVGFSYITDMNANPNDTTGFKDDNISAFGFDIGFYPFKTDIFKWKVYFDYAKYSSFGSGTALGTSFMMPNLLGGNLQLGVKYERRLINDQFIPSLFNMSYELVREKGASAALRDASSVNGNFGELAINVFNAVIIKGNYFKPDGSNNEGVFYSDVNLPELSESFQFSARYSKIQLDGLNDLFNLDERSVAEIEFGYALNTFLYLTTIYRVNWVSEENDLGDVIYKSQKTIIPQLSFKYSF
jgi:hypothetical protein